jgi:hypothetical protein
MRAGRIGLCFVFCGVSVACGVAACSSSDDAKGRPDGGTSDGGATSSGGKASGTGATASTGGTRASGGSSAGGATGAGGVTCGGEVCGTTSEGTGVEATPCCTTDNVCGVRIPLATKCLTRNQFGTVNPECAEYTIPGPSVLPGCCGATGCGSRITFENLGCISNQDLGKPKVACNQSGAPVDAAAPVDAGRD